MARIEPKTWVEIDQRNIIYNIKQFKKLIGQKVKLMSVVKSNAYGHGLIEVAHIAEKNGVHWLGTDSIDEALKIRQAGIKLPVLVLGYTLHSRLKEALIHNISLVIYNIETLRAMSEIKSKNKFIIHIKLETGTSRQGVLPNHVSKLIEVIKNTSNIIIEGVTTHYANIEDTTDHTYAQKQLDVFNKIVTKIEGLGIDINLKHTACSAATILYPETHFDMVRIGISQYGLWPSKETHVLAKLNESGSQLSIKNKLAAFNLKPVLTWKAKIAQIKEIKSGTMVSYGLTEKVTKNSKIAIIPIGYWDGYDRKLSSIGNILIKGQRCKVLGRVCMNMMVVDVSNINNIKVEDEAVILGKQNKEEITVEEIAQKTGTINYEVITRINPLIPRIVI